MPNAKLHDRANIFIIHLLAIPIAINDPLVGVLFLSGGVWSLLLSPDLDWDQTIKEKWGPDERKYSAPCERWPWPFRQWWKIYAQIFKHRGLSHIPIVGTLLRLLWLGWPIFLTILEPKLLWLWGGLLVADIAHIILDAI